LRTVTVGNGGEQIFKLCKKYGAIADAAEPIVNIYLTAAEHSLLSGLSGAIIEKRRYHSDVDGVRYTVDVFENALTGLILAEVEADDAATLAALAMPPWANREVTRDPWFRGGHLATVTSEMLRDHLQRIAES
jgi:CYTH domain-containing protein